MRDRVAVRRRGSCMPAASRCLIFGGREAKVKLGPSILALKAQQHFVEFSARGFSAASPLALARDLVVGRAIVIQIGQDNSRPQRSVLP